MQSEFKAQFLNNSFWNFLYSIIQKVGSLVFTILLARFLLPEMFGIYNLALSIALLFMVFSTGGLDITFLRYISYVISKSKRKTKIYFRYMLKLKLSITLFLSLILLIASYPLSVYIFKKPDLFLPLIIASLYMFFFSLENFFTQLLFARKKVKYVAVKEIAIQSMKFLLVLMLFFLLFNKYYVPGVFIALTFTSLFIFLILLFYLYVNMNYLFEKSSTILKEEKKRILKFFIYILFGTLGFAFFGYIDIIMLGILIPDASFIGYYRSAFVLASNIGGLLTFWNVLLPAFTQLKKQKIEKAFNTVFKYLMIIALPASFGLAILGKFFIVTIYGADYLPAEILLYALAFLIAVSVPSNLFLNLFSAKEKPQLYLPLLVFMIFLNIILNYIFIIFLIKYSFLLATLGAAIATLISWTLYSFGLAVLSVKKLGIRLNIFYTLKPLIASLLMSLILLFFINLLGDISLIIGLFLVFAGVSFYFLIMLLIKGIEKQDILLIKQLNIFR